MKVQRVLVRAAFPLMIGLGLIAVALWLFGALPARGASLPAPIDVSDSPASSSAPVQAQSVLTIPLSKAAPTLDGTCRDYGADSVTGTIVPSVCFLSDTRCFVRGELK